MCQEDVFGKLFKDSLSYHPSYLIVFIRKSSQSYTFLEYPFMLGGATRDHSCDNSLYDSMMNDYYSYVANADSFVLGDENKEEHMLGVFGNKGKSLEKELHQSTRRNINGFSLNLSPLYYEFSFKELNLLLESHSFHESIMVLESENKWRGNFKVLKVHLCGLSKTTFEKRAFKLNLKELIEKHLDYITSFIEILWKDVFLNDLLVQNKNLCVLSLHLAFSGNLFYHLPFKEFLEKMVFEESFAWIFINCKNVLILWDLKSFILYFYSERFHENVSFEFHCPFKDIVGKLFKTLTRSLLFGKVVLNSLYETLESIFRAWHVHSLINFSCITFNSFEKLSSHFHFPFKEVLSIEAFDELPLHEFLSLLCAYLERSHFLSVLAIMFVALFIRNISFLMLPTFLYINEGANLRTNLFKSGSMGIGRGLEAFYWRFGAYHQVYRRSFLLNPQVKREDHWERNELNHPTR
ncbi:hypothetical protein M9H77_26920 [Catharanthus roseus]|uniref:Uncharacterized protein n=1 Tax=Catharanthus roseus TaxID=4058 RepID=A0ACC0ADR8_CATRO|nr:hypothetical protein M9H77_26920 [Catharanthus roseus]